jgi:hypothetical protein
MLRIENIAVYDLYESIIASGYAMQTEYDVETIGDELDKLHDSLIDNKHLKRAIRLVQASKNSDIKCHDNFLTGIRVSFDIIYPNYISPEMQRYHWFDIVTSSSKMHRLTKMDLDKACNKYVTEDVKMLLNIYIYEYNKAVGTDKEYEAFMKIISNCPMGLELFMRVSTNYKQLQTMYHQRKNHRLKEDWGAFCEFVEKLPLFKLLITGEMTIEDID